MPGVGVSQSWFYKWRDGDVSVRRGRRQALGVLIATLFRKHRGCYGSPRITDDLRELGWRVSKNTVAKVMTEQQLVARPKRRRHGLTRQGKGRWCAPDLVGRHFHADQLDTLWFGDGTEIPTDEGVLYLDSVLDICSRRVVGFALGEHHDTDLAYAALTVAVAVRGGDVAGVTLHTDRGSEFTSRTFRRACTRLQVRQSMGRPGSALDNAAIESWHSTLQFELLDLEHFATKTQARRAVAAFIEEYNTDREHSSLQMRSPIDFEHDHHHTSHDDPVPPCATAGEGTQNLLCAYLAAAVLVGLVANSLLGAWWLDPLIALVVAAVAVSEGRQAWTGEVCC